MNELLTAEPTWYRALTLAERAALSLPPSEPDPDLAERRLARWRSQPPFHDAALLTRRLAADGLDGETFRRLLGESPEGLMARAGAPPWLRDLEEAFRRPAASGVPEAVLGRPDFLETMTPLLAWACERLRRGAASLIAERPGAPFDPEKAVEIFFPLLPFPINLLIGRTLTVELHMARREGRLAGETPEERFRGFVSALSEPAACLHLLRRHPVLAQQVIVCLRQWSDFALELLGRLTADWTDLVALFGRGADGDRLAEVEGGTGDRHRDGRCVLLLRFDSGLRLVYKPKPLAVDVHFQELLVWLNDRGLEPPLRTLRVLDRGPYGWEEFAAPEGCATAEEVARFYMRTGGLLALLYALEATDVHLDNLIAAGEHPVLVDLESLFHARFETVAPRKAGDVAERTMGHSVLRVGILPQRSGGDFETEGYDLSALGGTGGQWSAVPLPDWEGAGTDQIRLVRRRLRIPGSENRPRLDGAEIDTAAILGHGETILAGFTAVWRLLAGHQGELLAPGGLIDRFAGDEVRAILRPTMSYVRLLQESCHPHVFQTALERDRLFDRLWESVAAGPRSSALPDAVITAEHADLWRGDVPVFTTRPGSRDLWDSRGRRIPGFCDEASLESVRRRLHGMDDRDFARQSWFLRASLTTLELNTDVVRLPSYEVTPPRGRAGREALLAAARAVGDRLEALAIREERDVSWIGLTILGEHWSLVPLGPDLYAGLPGIALFLAWLGALTAEARFTKLAADALGTARRQLAGGAAVLPIVGAFNGWGGMVYTLVQLAALWDDPALLDEAEAIAAGPLADLLDRDDRWDLVAGSAGAVASLLTLHTARPSDRALDLAVRYGERLLTNAVPQAEGIAWQASGASERPLSGFSHGAAGIAWALARLATANGDARFRQAAAEAIRYERSLFSPTAGNWRDVRDIVRAPDAPQDGDFFMNAWCHGAPGIGIGRLLTRPHLDDPAFETEIEIALATTLREGFGQGHCLCHGDLGNLEALLLAALTGDGRWAGEVERLSAVILESFERVGWQCGVPEGVETPGLMIGLAGIGYGLLRLAEPERVPSVLALEGPLRVTETFDTLFQESGIRVDAP